MFDNDPKIDALVDAQGWVGFGIYFFLCQKAYGSNGYYYEWRLPGRASADSSGTGVKYRESLPDSAMVAANIARKMGGGIGSETVIQTVNLCLRIGLFDKGLFDRDGIITSIGIQRRYMDVAKKRKGWGIQKYWLLGSEEDGGLDSNTRKQSYEPPKPGYDPPEPSKEGSKKHKSRVEYSRVEKRVAADAAPHSQFTPPTLEEMRAYCAEINSPVNVVQFYNWCKAGGWKKKDGSQITNWRQFVVACGPLEIGRNQGGGARAGHKAGGNFSQRHGYDFAAIEKAARDEMSRGVK